MIERVCLDLSIPASKNASAGDMPSTRIVEILEEGDEHYGQQAAETARACLLGVHRPPFPLYMVKEVGGGGKSRGRNSTKGRNACTLQMHLGP